MLKLENRIQNPKENSKYNRLWKLLSKKILFSDVYCLVLKLEIRVKIQKIMHNIIAEQKNVFAGT